MSTALTLPKSDDARRRWGAVLAYLSEAYNLKDSQALSQKQAEIYADSCADLPIEAVENAAQIIVKTSPFFPKPADLRAVAEQQVDARLRAAISSPRAEPWHVECEDCEDTGFFRHRGPRGESPWAYRAKSQELRAEIIEWVAPCPCRPHNLTYQRKCEHERQRAKGRDAASTQEQRSSRGRGGFTRVGE